MSIAVDRIQNYYQYSDAESKFYQVMGFAIRGLLSSQELCARPIFVICICVFPPQAAQKW